MAEKRKDNKGRNLKTGEYWDEKNKRYMFRKMVDGERITFTASDLVELRKKENDLMHELDRGKKISKKSAKLTLNEYFDEWIHLYAKSGRKATTCTNYKSYYNTYILKTIGRKPIVKITKADCQKIINDMVKDNKKNSTLANLKSCLNILFECAIDDDIIVKNPVKNIKLPRTDRKKREAIPEENVARFMEYVKNSEKYSFSYPTFIVLFNCGLRIGELAALTWNDINFKTGEISITKSLNRYRKEDYGFTLGIGSTKTDTSNRTVYMSDVVRTALLELKMRSPHITQILPLVDDTGNVRGNVTGFVFLNSVGHVWSEPAFREFIKRIVARHNKDAETQGEPLIENFCPHQSRHTFTSAAYSVDADMKAVSEMLGHASTKVTYDTYTHLSNSKKKAQQTIVKAIKIS